MPYAVTSSLEELAFSGQRSTLCTIKTFLWEGKGGGWGGGVRVKKA